MAEGTRGALAPVLFRRRHNALSRGEREWRVEEGALVSVGGAGRERRWAWKDVIGVRLYHEPARHRPWRYTFELQFKSGGKVELDNAHFRARGDYEDRSEAYCAFVRASLARIAAARPKVRALIGETPKRYIFLALSLLLALGALAYALIAIPTPFDALSFAPMAKFALILLMLPVFWVLLRRALPRGVALDAVPDYVLPPPP